MLRATKFILLVGGFLVVSILWPYDPTTDTSDAFQSSSRSALVFPPFDPPAYLVFEDRWDGMKSKTVFTMDATVLPNLPLVLSVPEGRTILPGTEHLVFTHDIRNADGAPGSAKLLFHGANGAGWQATLAGATTRIHITEEMNDWSPDPNTRWSFVLSTDGSAVTLGGLRLDIQRGDDDVPGLLEYEDRWGDGTVVRIFDQRGDLYDARIVATDPRSEAGPHAPPFGNTPPDAPLIRHVPPRDVGEMRVELLYNSTTGSDLHYRPTLFFRGASLSNEWVEQGMPPTTSKRAEKEGRFLWHVPIEPYMWDSPFAPRTSWEVVVNWRGDSADQPVYMDGDYHFWVEVDKLPGS